MTVLQALINKQDNFELVRDQIAAILVTEVANQMTLAGAASEDPEQWNFSVYTERTNPWERWRDQGDEDEPDDETPIVNVWFDSASYDGAASSVMERQKTDGVFNIDVYGYGSARDDGDGHKAGDLAAVLNCQRVSRLVRNILMADSNTYLQMRGVVSKRWPQALNAFQPTFDGRNVVQVAAMRLSLRVTFNEFAPQYVGEPLELLSAVVKRTGDGQIILAADYDYT